MQDDKLFRAAFPFLEDVLGLPVKTSIKLLSGTGMLSG